MEPSINRENVNNRNIDNRDVHDSNVHKLYNETDPRNVSYEGDRSWKIMLEKVSNDMVQLWERESLLIRSEMDEKFSDVKNAFTSMAVGGALLFVGLISAVFAAIFILDVFMPLWLSSIIITAALFIIGGVMIGVAKKKLEANKLKPRHSIETLGEIKTTLKERVNEFRH